MKPVESSVKRFCPYRVVSSGDSGLGGFVVLVFRSLRRPSLTTHASMLRKDILKINLRWILLTRSSRLTKDGCHSIS